MSLQNPAGPAAFPAGADGSPGAAPPAGPRASDRGGLIIALALTAVLGAAVYALDAWVPQWLSGTAVARVAKSVEYPVYAIALGLAGAGVAQLLGVRERIAAHVQTEILIKTGLVFLGATVNLGLIARAAGPAIAQSVLLISAVFFITWWIGGRMGLDDKLRALLASAASICGVSAAVTAAAAVQARREQLAYTATLVIAFAVPSIFLLPWLAGVLGLAPAVAGAWIGGNIDTTAAVTAAGALAGPQIQQVAVIVKSTQNALIGVVAVALTAWFTLREARAVEADVDGGDGAGADGHSRGLRPRLAQVWERFPRFVIGFVAMSVLASGYAAVAGTPAAAGPVGVAKTISTVFFILAFVSIGLEFRVAGLRDAGWRPIAVFATAYAANLVVGLGLSSWLFATLEI